MVVSLGLDTHADDLVQEKATAGMGLATEDYRSMGRVIARAGREGCVSLCMTPIGQPCSVNQ